jgi:hypothetical protein
VSATALATIYRRTEGFFITSSDRTTEGVWVHSGSVERVDSDDPDAIGSALLRQLDRSTVDVRHPRQDEWAAQRQKSLDPIIALAKLRSWRSFIRDAAVAKVARDGVTIRVAPQVRDARRIDVFFEVPDLERKLLSPTEGELGAATLTAVGVDRI